MITESIQPIPLHVRVDKRKVALGERLFNDPRLSQNGTVACASCHDLTKGGTDGLPRSIRIKGAVGDLNAPTVFNSTFNYKQFWDGRADSLEHQIDLAIKNPKEMGYSWPEVLAQLKQDSSYVSAFFALYPDGIRSHNIMDAIATFERSLITPNSRFDRFLRGDTKAITEQEKAGYALFRDLGCIACHQGVNVGGNMFQTMGKFADYFEDRGNVTKVDLGRYNVTGRERDRYNFKVPGLRISALTAPYFHDGSAKTLEEAVSTMAKYQLGLSLSPQEVDLIVKFLNTLPGEYNHKSQ